MLRILHINYGTHQILFMLKVKTSGSCIAVLNVHMHVQNLFILLIYPQIILAHGNVHHPSLANQPPLT